jgi:hypothetical protein
MAAQPESWIKLGDFFTVISVIVALLGYLYTRSKDRELRIREQADNLRTAAALTHAKLDRYETLFLTFFYHIQPIITAADEMIVRTGSEIETRDSFWKELNVARVQLLAELSDEQIEISYAPLVGFHERLRGSVQGARQIDEEAFWAMLNDCQMAILHMVQRQKISATLGNELRKICDQYQKKLATDLGHFLRPTRELLLQIMTSSDNEILATYALPNKGMEKFRL